MMGPLKEGCEYLRPFLALSRTPHGVLDLATPALGALLWLGAFPNPRVMALGLIAAFSGYTAVYALNDLIDVKTDRAKIQMGGFQDSDRYLDAVMVRHPVAQGALSFKEGLSWVLFWAILAVTSAYLLNPVCLLIFLAGCALEVLYCLMLKVSHLRTIISGVVKTIGGIAAVYAVDANPSLLFVILLFLWLFFWEIGGQNIPADWTDMEEDRKVGAKTILVRFGPDRANVIILGSLIMAVALNILLFGLTPAGFQLPYLAASLFVGVYLLLIPAYRLYKTKERIYALALFNKASYYPLALFILLVIKIVLF